MRNLMHTTKKRLTPLLAASVLLTGGIGASILFTGGTADASPCTGAETDGTACSITGTLNMTGGTLTFTAPPALGWSETVNGLDRQLVDPTAADQTYQVDDATGTAPGWHVTVAAGQFASTGTGTPTLPNAATFSTNGSVTSMTATTAPSGTCTAGSTCTVPTDTTGYPVAITTGATAVNIYDASAGTGAGTITIGATTPVGWWLNVLSNATQGTYISTVSLELISGP
jgi:hypothetical protein